MTKRTSFIIFLLSLSFFLSAQDHFSFSPQKPNPGERVSFTYDPPAGVFDDTDKISCIVYKWGTYCDEGWWKTQKYPQQPVAIVLKKNGTHYEGTIQTDSLTRMLAFSFSSGVIKWKQQGLVKVLTSGKIDYNQNNGYCIPFYTGNGAACKFSNYMIGQYLINDYFNNSGIRNPKKAAEYFLKELELFPGSKYYALPSLLSAYGWFNPDTVKTVKAKEIEKLFAGGLQSEDDIALMVFLSAGAQYGYFKKLAKEKAATSRGTLSYLYNEFDEEKDIEKKEMILADAIRLYNSFGFEERLKDKSPFPNSPFFMQMGYLLELIRAGKLEYFRNYVEKTNFFKDRIPTAYYLQYLQSYIDTLKAHGTNPGFTEKFLLDLHDFYAGAISRSKAGITSPELAGDLYYTYEDKINAIATAAAVVSDDIVQWYSQKGAYRKAWKYAVDAKRYLQLITTEFNNAGSIATDYCLVAEKILPANQCKGEVEKFIADGVWKPEMLEVLQRIWVKQNKSEKGFSDYVNTIRHNSVEKSKKTLLGTRLNYAAPEFALKDLDGREVSLKDLAGKTVVLDFWATWCGPCKASFPGMQKLVHFYKDDLDIKFLFVDTWEGKHADKPPTDEEIRKTVADFIKNKNYSFHVVLDKENKVVQQFQVEGIPTKFIIDKNGNVRYKVLGYDYNEGKLFDDVDAMIQSVK